jgi:hypothetical protein
MTGGKPTRRFVYNARIVAAVWLATGCKPKVSARQCDEIIDRFADMVVRERFPDAGADEITKERQREREEAKSDELRNCTSEVQLPEHACAIKATSSKALLKCLE